MQPNTSPTTGVLTPAVAAAFEMHVLHGWHFADAINRLEDALQNDCSCPASAMFTPAEVRAFYLGRVNAVAMPTAPGD